MPLSSVGSPLFRSSLAYVNGSIPAGNTITNSTSEIGWASQYTIPAKTLKPGSVLTLEQGGTYQAGLTQNITPRVRFGPSATAMTSRTILATTAGAVSGLLNAASDTPWGAITKFIVMDDGTIMPWGHLLFSTSLTAALNALVATKTPVSGVDLTVDNVLTASAQWGAAMTANTITCTQFIVRIDP